MFVYPHRIISNYHSWSSRSQYVTYNNVNSLKQPVTRGIPQGSILGPLRFLVSVDDMQNCSSLLNFILFADNTNIFISDKKFIYIISLANALVKNEEK